MGHVTARGAFSGVSLMSQFRPLLLQLAFVSGWAVSAGQAHGQCGQFVRGDANADGAHNLTDSVVTLDHLFFGGGGPSCADAADTNDDGTIDLSDPLHTLRFLFSAGEEPPPPLSTCGSDPTPDDLSCLVFPPCGTRSGEDAEHCGANCVSCLQKNWDNVAEYACVNGECRIGFCEEGFYDVDGIAENGCESSVPPDGTPCDDGNPCTEDDIYLGGFCGGTPKNCVALNDDCNRGVCDFDTGECIQAPRPEGTPCDDGNPATVSDRCDEKGTCRGTAFP